MINCIIRLTVSFAVYIFRACEWKVKITTCVSLPVWPVDDGQDRSYIWVNRKFYLIFLHLLVRLSHWLCFSGCSFFFFFLLLSYARNEGWAMCLFVMQVDAFLSIPLSFSHVTCVIILAHSLLNQSACNELYYSEVSVMNGGWSFLLPSSWSILNLHLLTSLAREMLMQLHAQANFQLATLLPRTKLML